MYRLAWTLACAASLALAGCPSDDVPGDDTESNSGAPTTSSTSDGGTSISTTSAGTDSMSGTSDTTTGSTTDGTTTSAGTDGSSTGSATGTGSTGGRADPCAELDREACAGDDNCQPIACLPFQTMGDGFCLGDQEFVGCRSADLGCAEVRTVACESVGAPEYTCPDSCIPEGWQQCAPPGGGDAMMCPDNGG